MSGRWEEEQPESAAAEEEQLFAAITASLEDGSAPGVAVTPVASAGTATGGLPEPDAEPEASSSGVIALDINGVVQGISGLSLNISASCNTQPASSSGPPPPPATSVPQSARAAGVAARGAAAAASRGAGISSSANSSASAPAAPAGASGVGEDLLVQARAAGAHARRKLAGEIEAVPKSAAARGQKRFFAIVRGIGPETGIVNGPWDLAKGYVLRRGDDQSFIEPSAVFHGFCTRAEAEHYFRAACPGEAIATLPPRP